MTWRSHEVEATIAKPQEVLAPYVVDFCVPGTDACDLTGKPLKEVLQPSALAPQPLEPFQIASQDFV